jgi:hypothetical protein
MSSPCFELTVKGGVLSVFPFYSKGIESGRVFVVKLIIMPKWDLPPHAFWHSLSQTLLDIVSKQGDFILICFMGII